MALLIHGGLIGWWSYFIPPVTASSPAIQVQLLDRAAPPQTKRSPVSEAPHSQGKVRHHPLAIPAPLSPPPAAAPEQPTDTTYLSAPATPTPPLQGAATSNPPAPPAATQTPPQFKAAYLHNPYPVPSALSIARGEAGVVRLRVSVSASGAPLAVKIVSSSGYALLDKVAQETVRQHWTFIPAKQGETPIAAEVEFPIRFDPPTTE